MTNHVHVVATPHTATGLAKTLGRTHNDYARWQNIRRRECGHMWQSRFHSCPVDSRYLWAVLAYVERNPVRAGLVSECREWRWSSARNHVDPASEDVWLSMRDWAGNWTPDLWRAALADGLGEAEMQARLSEATETGRPLGEPEVLESCERQSGLLLRRQKPGPKGESQDEGELAGYGESGGR